MAYLLSALLVSASVYLIFVQESLYVVFDSSVYLPFHAAVEIFTILVAVAVAYVSLKGYRRDGSRTILLLGSAFLVQAALDTIHNMAYPGMPLLLVRSGTNEAIYLWLFARISGSFLLLASPVLPEKEMSPEARDKVLLYTLAAVALLSVGSVYTVNQLLDKLPLMFIPGKGLTMLKVGLEFLVTIVLGITGLLYLKSYLSSGNRTILMFTIGVSLFIFAEVGFMLYRHAYDIHNTLGHIFKLAAFIAFLLGLILAR